MTLIDIVVAKGIEVAIVIDVCKSASLRENVLWLSVFDEACSVVIGIYKGDSVARTQQQIGVAITIDVSGTNAPRWKICDSHGKERWCKASIRLLVVDVDAIAHHANNVIVAITIHVGSAISITDCANGLEHGTHVCKRNLCSDVGRTKHKCENH